MKLITFRTRYIPALIPLLDFWSWPVDKKIGAKHFTVNIWDKGNYTVMWDQEGKNQIAQYAFKHLLKNKKSLKKIRQEAIEQGKKLVAYCQEFAEETASPKLTDFIKFFKKLEKLNQKFIEKSMVYWLFTGEIIEAKIKALIIDYDKEERLEILKIMSLPLEPSYSQIEEKHFERIVKIAQDKGIRSQKTISAIEKFSQEYFWLPYEYVGPTVWDIKTITQRVKESLQKPIKTITASTKNKQKHCIQKFKLNQNIVTLFKILQTVILMQDDRKLYNAQACYYINGLIPKKTSDYFNLSFEEARYLDFTVLENNKNHKTLKEILDARKKFLLVIQTDRGNKFFTEDQAKKELKKLSVPTKKEKETTDVIKGSIANQGIVKGKVKILFSSSEANKFKPGDILVSPMTTPDFVPIMDKAAAIITDEGGITCHAAIIAREMNVPCIVGTEIATKILKDGDLVEVDADKGIIKIHKH